MTAIDQYGKLMERKLFTDARRTWDIIVPSAFCRTPETMGVIFYDRSAGYASLQSIDQYGNLRELRGFDVPADGVLHLTLESCPGLGVGAIRLDDLVERGKAALDGEDGFAHEAAST
jgi:hypothetical protein